MVKVLTIRDAKTGALIAQEQLRPKDDKDSVLTRIYRKAVGPEGPEFAILSRSKWSKGQETAGDVGQDLSGFELAVLGPKLDSGTADPRLVLATVTEAEPAARVEVPTEKRHLEDTREGKRRDSVIRVPPETPLSVGDTVKFVEASWEAFGHLYVSTDGPYCLVEVTRLIKMDPKRAGNDLYHIEWNPKTVEYRPRHRSGR